MGHATRRVKLMLLVYHRQGVSQARHVMGRPHVINNRFQGLIEKKRRKKNRTSHLFLVVCLFDGLPIDYTQLV